MFDKKMREALAADAEKLQQLTGKDHGLEFFVQCLSCGSFWFSREPLEDETNCCPECGIELEPLED
jgi:acetyl-CoA carboxylase beta subunit